MVLFRTEPNGCAVRLVKMLDSSGNFGLKRRASSLQIADEITENKARIMVVDPRGMKPLEETNFDDVIPIGKGNQGSVYAILIRMSDGTEEKMVAKCLHKKRRVLRCRSFSSLENASITSRETISAASAPISQSSFQGLKHPIPKNASRQDPLCPSPFTIFKSISRGDKLLVNNNLIHLTHIIEHQGEKYALSAYCSVFLDDFIETKLRYLFDNDREKYLVVVKKIMINTLNALMILNYVKGFVHRDIKPENIALCEDEWCFTDFEASARMGATSQEFVGSPYYMHPACFLDNGKTTHPGNDLYALGLVFDAILFQPKRFKSETIRELSDEKITAYKIARATLHSQASLCELVVHRLWRGLSTSLIV